MLLLVVVSPEISCMQLSHIPIMVPALLEQQVHQFKLGPSIPLLALVLKQV